MSRARTRTIYLAGEHGVNRVWLSRRAKGAALILGWYETLANGRRRRRAISLGAMSLDQAKEEAELLAARLRKEQEPVPPDELTLGQLFAIYEEHCTPHKSKSAQDHDRRAIAVFTACWGSGRPVSALKPMDWDYFVRMRRSGELSPSGSRGGPVRDRTLEQDLSLLRAVLRWASQNELIDREPMSGCKIPREKNVRRPLLYEEEYQAMLAAAPGVHLRCRLALMLAHETGHRSKSIRLLQWSDVDLDAGRIRWRADHDKTRREHVVPVTPTLLEELRRTQRGSSRWLFPSDRMPDSPVGRETFESWWRALEAAAGVERVEGRGWHSLRRKFATERKQGSLADLAAAGGWHGTQTLTKVYIQPDEQSIKSVVTERTPLTMPGNSDRTSGELET